MIVGVVSGAVAIRVGSAVGFFRSSQSNPPAKGNNNSHNGLNPPFSGFLAIVVRVVSVPVVVPAAPVVPVAPVAPVVSVVVSVVVVVVAGLVLAVGSGAVPAATVTAPAATDSLILVDQPDRSHSREKPWHHRELVRLYLCKRRLKVERKDILDCPVGYCGA